MWSGLRKIIVIFIALLFLLLVSFVISNIKTPEINLYNYDFWQITNQTSLDDNGQLVKKVIDGDTFELDDGRKVRMIGIDTPEVYNFGDPKECFADEASKYTKEQIEGKRVQLVKDTSETDRYGRLLRYVYIDSIFVNEELVRNGYAYSKSYPPDTSFQEIFTLAENAARENQVGLWSSCSE